MVRSLQEDLESYGKPQAANIDSADLAKQSFDAVIIKNISERCTSGEILQSMEHCGFSIQNVTYIHLPSSAKGNLGYCFVGFKSSQLAKDFCESSEFQLHLRGKNKIIHVEPLGFSLPIYQKGQGANGERLLEMIEVAKERAVQRRHLSDATEEVREQARALEELLTKEQCIMNIDKHNSLKD
eukprot:symbB.v1.2.033937.t1/scaffold4291.1/size41828/1